MNDIGNIIANGLPFVNDEAAIGKWEFFALSSKIGDIDKLFPQAFEGIGFHEIYFLPDGQKYWIFEGWTAGILLTHLGGDEPIVEHKYVIREYNTEKYLFVDISGEQKLYCILRQVSSKRYNLMEIGRHDDIDMPFVNDNSVIGTWKSVAYVDKISNFTNEMVTSKLWLKGVCFYIDGTAERQYGDMVWTDRWTSGYLLDKAKSTASKYCIEIVDGKEYLFLEWKMGNYVYGGQEPEYYVFQRA